MARYQFRQNGATVTVADDKTMDPHLWEPAAAPSKPARSKRSAAVDPAPAADPTDS